MGHRKSSPSQLESTALGLGNPSTTTTDTHILMIAAKLNSSRSKGTKLQHIHATLHPQKGTLYNA